MSNNNRRAWIANAVGVLAIVLPVTMLMAAYWPASLEFAFDTILFFASGAIIWAMHDSRIRNFVIAVFAAPIAGVVLYQLVGGPALLVLTLVLVEWLVLTRLLTKARKTQVARFALQVVAVLMVIYLAAPLLAPVTKMTSAIAFSAAAAAMLAWRAYAGPKRGEQRTGDPWRWSRDKDGTWRA